MCRALDLGYLALRISCCICSSKTLLHRDKVPYSPTQRRSVAPPQKKNTFLLLTQVPITESEHNPILVPMPATSVIIGATSAQPYNRLFAALTVLCLHSYRLGPTGRRAKSRTRLRILSSPDTLLLRTPKSQFPKDLPTRQVAPQWRASALAFNQTHQAFDSSPPEVMVRYSATRSMSLVRLSGQASPSSARPDRWTSNSWAAASRGWSSTDSRHYSRGATDTKAHPPKEPDR
jgi:hypothetical protein